MESMASAVDMSAMIWAALQADDARPASAHAPAVSVSQRLRSDGYEEDGDEDEDEEEDDDEMAPVMPQPRAGSTNAPALLPLPPSFYTTAAGVLPDVVPSYLTSKAYAAPSSSELFLDDILHSQDDFHGSTTVDSGDGSGGGGSRLTPERLHQLEDNYERKKKRAKINRKDLNSRFQELMDLLHLKEDRKLNRAKVLEKAIEHIQKLTSELKAVKSAAAPPQQHQQQQRAMNAPQFGAFPVPVSRQQPQHAPIAMPQWPTAAGAVPSLNLAGNPMMWMPMMPHVAAQAPRMPLRSAGVSGRRQSAARNSVAATATMQTQTSPLPASTSDVFVPVRRPGLKRGRDMETASPVSQLVHIAQEVPNLLELCDAWTLSRLAEVSRDFRSTARRDALWSRLCQRRWRLDGQSVLTHAAFTQWQQLHRANEMPRCLALNGASLLFASGRCGPVGLWSSLVHRSNGRTTRTVLVDGRVVVRQVVELNVLIQNLHPFASLRLTDQLRVASSASSSGFRLITSDSRAHLQPHLVAVNDVACAAHDVRAVELFHGDFCVLSVFVECEGLDLEQQFLERVDALSMSCELWTKGRPGQTVNVHADALPHKHSLIIAPYESATEKSV